MLRLLDRRGRRVLLAHERAHLRHRHHLLAAGVGAAAALNPVLLPVRTVVEFLLERWADEDAAAEVGSRITAARTVATAACGSPRPRWPEPLRFGDTAAADRVEALLQCGRHTSCTPTVIAVSAAVTALAAAVYCSALFARIVLWI
jgi:hypothetical protein